MHLLVAVAAFALLTSSASAADNKGLRFDDAKAACEVATVLEAMEVAATMAAEEAATIGGAARAWGKTAAEVAAATGNTTVLDHVPAPWEVTEKVEKVRRDATHITAEAGTQAQRVKDFIQLFAQYSGGDSTSTNARLCIGKTTGSAGSDTMSGTMDGAEYIYGRLGCTRSPENINASARRLLNDATLQALDENGTPLRSGEKLAAQLAVPQFTLSTGVTVGDDSKGCPLTVMRGKNNKKPAGVIELTTNKARQVDWAGIWQMTPAGDNTHSASGSGSNAATSFSTIDGAQDRLNTLADRMARMREARKALTKLCTESSKSMPPTAGQARNICTKPATQDTETLKQAYAKQPRPTETSTGETRLGEAKHANSRAEKATSAASTHCPDGTKWDETSKQCRANKKPSDSTRKLNTLRTAASLFLAATSSTMHLR
ncbi:hypothetical protein ERJ75_001148500 [Trypanosoma vivax]|uniref:Variant surface glycoprotein (VSG) n=1 Tax=Trypanosoma vivax (strain Y486) TaxID=1055687 RepID=F9WTJ5_TRYVY|nr:hypothetical protein ERJ75_001148500 [Trypanosoma vivax]CCD20888.1 hypothetical protein, conserved in T. vivax [Trypanosoma vivax Y486]|eukprot:CCD20888.1 hypothetical protein, conserved in T. vivax [Trypanosoma vivax Y486]